MWLHFEMYYISQIISIIFLEYSAMFSYYALDS